VITQKAISYIRVKEKRGGAFVREGSDVEEDASPRKTAGRKFLYAHGERARLLSKKRHSCEESSMMEGGGWGGGGWGGGAS